MKTKFEKKGDTIIVNLEGHVDHESTEPLKNNLSKLIQKQSSSQTDSIPKKVVFNLENLEFVGSSGISSLFQTLKEFSTRAELKPKYCNVGSEYKRIIKAFDEEQIFEIFDNEEKAKKSFDC